MPPIGCPACHRHAGSTSGQGRSCCPGWSGYWSVRWSLHTAAWSAGGRHWSDSVGPRTASGWRTAEPFGLWQVRSARGVSGKQRRGLLMWPLSSPWRYGSHSTDVSVMWVLDGTVGRAVTVGKMEESITTHPSAIAASIGQYGQKRFVAVGYFSHGQHSPYIFGNGYTGIQFHPTSRRVTS